MRLTQQQIDAYNRDGFIILHELFARRVSRGRLPRDPQRLQRIAADLIGTR
jgi:hypothetical protein